MNGNILITVMIILALLSLSTLYTAQEALRLYNLTTTERDRLQLDLFINESLQKTKQIIQNLPIETTPTTWPNCQQTPCLLSAQEPNFFLEQPIKSWSTPSVSTPLALSSDKVYSQVILEHLNTQIEADTQLITQYFRTTFLLQSAHSSGTFRMQATWKKTTLNGNMFQVEPLSRLAWR